MLAVTAGIASPAHASTYVITYEGTVFDSFNDAGVFGAVSLDGLAFRATYYLSAPSTAAVTTQGNDASGWRSLSGYNGAPISAASLTINGQTIQIISDYSSTTRYNNWFGLDLLQQTAYSNDNAPFNYNSESMTTTIYSRSNNIVDDIDIYGDAYHQVGLGDEVSGGFSIRRPSILSAGADYTSGKLRTTSVSIVSLAVPEPAAWLMMIAGFGMIGIALRRRAKTPRHWRASSARL